ncbi:hypothetical protein [Tsukamurella strandjordii]|uniref:Uncharacterized protein n=1 Tax=Tsukamurella strandjordii TaxID=147577 RepID=A0AA90NI77_9ACTN|nr:hypothetical protein [Tsukamurella strandjordii]MDP0398831.1 hypothetical protein [Tsukamurella strandjordii]
MPPWAEVTPGWGSIVQTAIPLIALALVAAAGRGAPRVLLLIQSAYWTISFIARPVLLLVATPAPSFGDNIADTRLFHAGYDRGIAQVLPPVTSGLWIYVACVAAFVLFQRLQPPDRRPDADLPKQSAAVIATFVVLWCVGLAARGFAYLTGTVSRAGEVAAANPYLSIFTGMGAIGAAALILYLRLDSPRWNAVAIAVLVGGEFAWGVVQSSKTPFMGALMAVTVRLLLTGFTKMRAVLLAVGGIGAVGVFGALQGLKVGATTAHLTSGIDAPYPPAWGPLLPLIRRFDLFEAATDNTFYRGPGYLDISDVLLRMPMNLIPAQLGVDKKLAGPDWAERVRASSVDMSGVQVSLAEGHINEGIRIGGTSGVLVESILVLLAVCAVSRCLRGRSVPVLTMGVVFVALPALFERGALGISEVAGKGLQQCVLATAVFAVVWFIRILGAQDRQRARDAHAEASGGEGGMRSECGTPPSNPGPGVAAPVLAAVPKGIP